MTQDAKWVFRAEMPVRWGDMDAFGHVNNSVYFSYLEQARASWWDSIQIDTHRSPMPKEEGPVVLTAQCCFKKAIYYPADLWVDVYAHPPGQTSFMLDYEIRLENDPDMVYTEGSTKIVWVNYKASKAVRLPDSILKFLPEPKTQSQ